MGVGMYLYFWMIRIVAIMFACCTIFSIPAMILNQQVSEGKIGSLRRTVELQVHR